MVTVGISNATRCHNTQSGEEMATDCYQILTDPCTRSQELIYAYTTDTISIILLLDFLTRFNHDFQTFHIKCIYKYGGQWVYYMPVGVKVVLFTW